MLCRLSYSVHVFGFKNKCEANRHTWEINHQPPFDPDKVSGNQLCLCGKIRWMNRAKEYCIMYSPMADNAVEE